MFRVGTVKAEGDNWLPFINFLNLRPDYRHVTDQAGAQFSNRPQLGFAARTIKGCSRAGEE